MNGRERTVAAVLFVLTALILPLLGTLDGSTARPDEVRFLVNSALAEIKVREALETVLPLPAPAEADGKGSTAAGPLSAASVFDVERWRDTAAQLPPARRTELVVPLAATCRILDREEEAARLLSVPGTTIGEGTAFACLLENRPCTDPQRIERDIEASYLPPWVADTLRDRLESPNPDVASPPSSSLAPLDRERLSEDLSPYLGSLGIVAGSAAALFLAGLVLLVLLPGWLRRRRGGPVGPGLPPFALGPLHLYLLLALWLLLTQGLGMGAALLMRDSLPEPMFMLVAYLASAAAGVVLVQRMGGMRVESLAVAVDLDRDSLGLRPLALGVGGHVVAVPVVFVLSLASTLLLGGGDEGVNPSIPLLVSATDPVERGTILVTIVVLAPLFEEFLFRGFLFQQCRRHFGVLNGMALSALMFAAVHLSMESFLPLFGLGMLLAGVYHVTRSLWAAVLTHALWNLGTLLVVMTVFD